MPGNFPAAKVVGWLVGRALALRPMKLQKTWSWRSCGCAGIYQQCREDFVMLTAADTVPADRNTFSHTKGENKLWPQEAGEARYWGCRS
jgi:hypothetical protein